MPDLTPPVSPPDSLTWLEGKADGASWLKALPHLLNQARDRFQLDSIGAPYSGGCVSYVVPARRDGRDVVLKLQFVDRSTRHEADALRHWNGQGAICLLDHAPDLGALLLEPCRPGRFLADDQAADTIAILSDLLRQLLVPAAAPFLSLKEEAALWRANLQKDWLRAGQPCGTYLVDLALGALKDLQAEPSEQVLLHQDLHGHNILSAERAPWLAIDPKPLVGDPAFALSPIVRSFEFGHSKQAALYRLDRLSEELDLDRERARLWTIGQTMAWAFDGSTTYSSRHLETVSWLAD